MNAVEDGKRAGRISLQASYTAENDEKSDDVASNPQKTSKFERSKKTYNVDSIKFKRLRRTMEDAEEKIGNSLSALADTEILLQQSKGSLKTTDGSKTYNIQQSALEKHLVMSSRRNIFDINLTEHGPYNIDFCSNGRWLAIGGRRGHIATFDFHSFSVGTELNVDDEILDIHYLHNETLIAVAQKNYVYIYDNNGTEIHCLKRHENPYKIDFLPHHFLLVSVGQSGWIKWQDVSTGEYVTGHSTKKGPCRILRQNPNNAISVLGHSDGCVSMWSPAAGKPLVTMLTHRGGVSDVCVTRDGSYMVTTGLDGYIKVWDVRNFQQTVHDYKLSSPALSLDVSDQGLIAVGLKRGVQVLQNMTCDSGFTSLQDQGNGGIRWRGPDNLLYMSHKLVPDSDSVARKRKRVDGGSYYDTRVVDLSCARFRPLEDCLVIGHSNGFSSIVVPGAGEANIDSYSANPYETTKQRREHEIHMLLDKLRPDMISLEGPSQLGSHLVLSSDQKKQSEADVLDETQEEKKQKKRKATDDIAPAINEEDEVEEEQQDGEDVELRSKLRKLKRRLRRRQQNVIDSDKLKLERAIESAKSQQMGEDVEEAQWDVRPSTALSRFT